MLESWNVDSHFRNQCHSKYVKRIIAASMLVMADNDLLSIEFVV